MRPLLLALITVTTTIAADRVKVDSGILEGAASAGSSIRIFRGVPFAAPPVGKLRWQAPQPVEPWSGVRQAVEFGSRCVQTRVFDDIIFRSKQMNEDCLYLTVWTPAKSASERLPVYVWFHGGGFVAGSGDEPRYDGESFAKHGIIVVNANYRLGVFGFLAHPELTSESAHHASGNYGMLDEAAAIQWVHKNIAAFGGDPNKITIGGESAGSASVSALMASPLSRDLLHQAIGESGAFFGNLGGHSMTSLADSEKAGVKFADSIGAGSLAGLRGKPADELLAAASKRNGGFSFWPIVDGYFLPSDVATIFAEGKQSKIALLAGWNADEVRMSVSLAKEKPSAKSFSERLSHDFPADSDMALKLYPASTDEEAIRSAGDLASDRFIVFGTWEWLEAQAKTGRPVYRFQFDKAVPIPSAMKNVKLKTLGSAHAAELEYVFETFDSKPADWQADDRKTGKTMNEYWANFIKKGDPTGHGLAKWADFVKTHEVMHINTESRAQAEQHRDRYEFLKSVEAHASNASK